MAQITPANKAKTKHYVRIFLGRDEKGKRLIHNATVEGGIRKANDYVRDYLSTHSGKTVQPSKETVQQFLERWLRDVASIKTREYSRAVYGKMFNAYIYPQLGRIQVSKLKAPAIQEAVIGLMSRGIKPQTIRTAFITFKAALKQAKKWRIINENPMELVELPQVQRSDREVISTERARIFLKSIEGTRYEVLFKFAVLTGMRPSEFLALRWRDLLLPPTGMGRATVRRSVVWVGKKYVFSEPKTKSSRRSIPLPAVLVAELQGHRREQLEARMKAGPRYADQELVFTDRWGQPLRINTITGMHLKPLLKQAGLPASLRSYDLRHACATILLEGGTHPKIVSERLGHASIKTTLDIYSHVLPSLQDSASEQLESALFVTKESQKGTGTDS